MSILRSSELVVHFERPVQFLRLYKLEGIQHHPRHIVRDLRLQRLSTLFLVGVLEEHSNIRALRAGVVRIDETFQSTVGSKREGSLAFGAVCVRRKDRQGDDLARWACCERAVASLLI